MEKIDLILTGAGKYKRFRRFSYEVPKYLLPVSNRTLLHHILKGFGEGEFNSVSFVGNEQDRRFSSVVSDIMQEMTGSCKVRWIEDTEGQAQSLLESLEGSQRVMVHNIDTVLLNRDWSFQQGTDADCVIDVFDSSNKEYSYVITEDDKAIEIREKSVISSKASSGCYYFKNTNILKKYISDKTVYISEAINSMIKDGCDVRVTKEYKGSDTVVLGTPEEYLANIQTLRYFR